MTEKVQIHVKVSKRTRQRLKLMADEDGSSLLAVAEALIEQALELEEFKRSEVASPNNLAMRARARHWRSVAPSHER